MTGSARDGTEGQNLKLTSYNLFYPVTIYSNQLQSRWKVITKTAIKEKIEKLLQGPDRLMRDGQDMERMRRVPAKSWEAGKCSKCWR